MADKLYKTPVEKLSGTSKLRGVREVRLRFSTIALAIMSVLVLVAASAQADTVRFEGYAFPGGLVNVSPGAPYSEAGYTFTPGNAQSAVFDAAFGLKFPGDSSSWFGFDNTNLITMTGPTPFNLDSLEIGPIAIGPGVVDFTITADVFGGGTLSATFTGLTTATLETLNWTNLSDVQFSATDNAGMDNIVVEKVVTPVPEPGTMLLLGTGLAGLAGTIRRKMHK